MILITLMAILSAIYTMLISTTRPMNSAVGIATEMMSLVNMMLEILPVLIMSIYHLMFTLEDSPVLIPVKWIPVLIRLLPMKTTKHIHNLGLIP